jgi:hypothetical protein
MELIQARPSFKLNKHVEDVHELRAASRQERRNQKTYGADFAKGCAESDRLSDVLHKMDEPSLSKLVRDHEAGKLEQICSEAA